MTVSTPIIIGYSIDTGTLLDGRTSDTTPTFSGTGTANNSIELTAEDSGGGTNSVGTALIDGLGNWTINSLDLTSLAAGSTFTFSVVESDGILFSSASSPLTGCGKTPERSRIL
jgi:hypothetical protein